MSINTLNESMFKNHRSYHVLVEEDNLGMFGFVTEPRYRTNSSEPYLKYGVRYNVAQAYPIYDGDPLLEAVEKLAPHLSLYKVTPSYEFEYVETII